jgi:hypothetical protein
MAALGVADSFYLFRRRLQREVPWFAVYLITIIVQSVVSILLIKYAPLYVWYYAGWSFAGLDLTFEYMFTVEGIRNMLVDYPTVRAWVRNILLTVAALFVIVALISIPYGADQPNVYMKVTHVTVRSVRIIQVALLLSFFAVASYLGLSWKNYQFGILLGLGLYACTNLACEAYVAQVGESVGWKVNMIDSFATICMMLIFLVYLIKADPSPPLSAHTQSATELDGWDRALTDIIKK